MGDYGSYFAGMSTSAGNEEMKKKIKPLVTYSVTNSDNERFEVTPGETRVVFIGEDYYPTPLFPCWDSVHACVGTVQEVSMTGGVTVKWDNGTTALNLQGKDLAPHVRDLILHQGDEPTPAQEENPNIAFKLEKSKKTPGKTWSKHSGWTNPKRIKEVQLHEPNPDPITRNTSIESEDLWDGVFTNTNEDEHDR